MFQQKVGKFLAKRLAKQVGKEGFLEQLKAEWRAQLPKNKDMIDVEVIIGGSLDRIQRSGFKDVFDAAGITEADLREALLEVIRE